MRVRDGRDSFSPHPLSELTNSDKSSSNPLFAFFRPNQKQSEVS